MVVKKLITDFVRLKDNLWLVAKSLTLLRHWERLASIDVGDGQDQIRPLSPMEYWDDPEDDAEVKPLPEGNHIYNLFTVVFRISEN
ncbi:hypothetical protein TNCV_3369481 [Trichonephila clavipes]|uniref:Uncharacterized protein n=1 Tax=Trichonephila clavipes TaxID=2585209 RepID=A0A8X6R774_TRICX|nr:hypothetical protein TNCV_3369481 [Trichonephila clavipes]